MKAKHIKKNYRIWNETYAHYVLLNAEILEELKIQSIITCIENYRTKLKPSI
jgi:hypothetical protein